MRAGLLDESARSVTGRRCPHSGLMEDFLARQPVFFYENGRNSNKKSRTIDPKVTKWNQPPTHEESVWHDTFTGNPLTYTPPPWMGSEPNGRSRENCVGNTIFSTRNFSMG